MELRILEARGKFYVQQKFERKVRYGFLWIKTKTEEVWHSLSMHGDIDYLTEDILCGLDYPYGYNTIDKAKYKAEEFMRFWRQEKKWDETPEVIHEL